MTIYLCGSWRVGGGGQAPGASSVVEEVESANATATRRLLARGRSRGNADGEEDSGEAIDTSPGDFLGYTLPGGDPGYRLPAQFRMSRYVANNHRLVRRAQPSSQGAKS